MTTAQQDEYNRLTHLQAQAERTAGQLLTRICHTESAAERARLLSLAFWTAGRAETYEDEAKRLGEAIGDGARGPRR